MRSDTGENHERQHIVVYLNLRAAHRLADSAAAYSDVDSGSARIGQVFVRALS
jgi:hypothetical protein